MRINGAELIRLAMPLKSPFTTSFGTEYERDVLLVRLETDGAVGWGECVAMADPLYSPEFADMAAEVTKRFLLPALVASPGLHAGRVATALAPVKGHRMAKAAVELAVLDAELRTAGIPLSQHLGSVHDLVPSGVSVGIADSIPELLDTVGGFLDEGYVRIKLKIKPGWDVEPVRAVRERFGDIPLQVDANTAYTLADALHLAKLDEFGLLLIEQPLDEDDLPPPRTAAWWLSQRQIAGWPPCCDPEPEADAGGNTGNRDGVGHGMADKQILIPGPDHPITVKQNPARVVVKLDGKVVADTTAALVLQESNYPAVQYVPLADVDASLIEHTEHSTWCPYKGDASYYSVPSGGEKLTNAIWTYEAPHDAVAEIKDHVAFYADRFVIEEQPAA
ncbi:DUF427 domain-containing protein [Pseudonocardia sp. GCM10023141]|uniref:DUF427 domain-containing protein n=1 Tax=Pseudonocardia sp. GCM10023141 TaxID=3252653 RepID=UPI0036194099